MNRSSKYLFLVILTLVSLIVSAVRFTPASAAGGTMEIVPLSLPPGWTYGYLYGVWGSSATNVYAVGYGYNGSALLPLLYYKAGDSWAAYPFSLPTGFSSGYLYGIWGSSLSDIYVVGSGNNSNQPLLYHWNGSSWTGSSPGLPTGWSSGVLTGVWGSSASDVYIIGYGYNGSASQVQPLLYHWNGSSWSVFGLALPTGWSSGNLYAVWGSSASDVYAVGSGYIGSANVPLLYRSNGTSWSVLVPTLPTGWSSGNLKGIWGSAANNIYVVGSGYNGSTNVPLYYQWDGLNWASSALPLPTGVSQGSLLGIWGSASSDIYAVGYGYQGDTFVPLMYHRDGTSWTDSSPVIPTGWRSDYLYGVWGSGFSDVYAVGSGHNGSVDMPLLYHSSQVGQDVNAPGDVTNLTATAGTAGGSVNLSWKAPADDAGNNASGSVASYLVKYSTSPFTSWTDGTPVTSGLPIPGAPGTTQTMTVSNLTPGTLYYFAVRGQDEQYNLSVNYVTASATAKTYGTGKYDDAHAAWHYTGTWTTYSGPGPYNNTLHQSNTAGSYAEVTFDGTEFTLTYLKAAGRGSIDVYIDGTKVTTLNANSPTLVWQATWTSATLTSGIHTVRFQNAVGGWIDLDAIQVLGSSTPPTPVGAGTYDDTDAAWNYSGTWTTYNGSGPYNNTLHQSNTAGSYAELTFSGVQVKLTYLKASGRGSIDVYIDGAKITTLNANSPTLVWQATWTSTTLTSGTHTVRFQNASGGWIDLDAIQVSSSVTPPTPVGAGTYDDTDSAWNYSGTWSTYSGPGPYNNTLHQSNITGNYAEVTFNGVQIKLTYLKALGRGTIDVYIDGTKVDTINANSPTLVWQATWTSAMLTSGTHTVRFVNASGSWIDLDAIQVSGALTVVGAGTYDDTDSAWNYSGTWSTYSGGGPYNNSLHQSNVAGSYAEVAFNGVQIKLTYLKAPGRGLIDVYIDGTKVNTIDANSATLAWQATWTSFAMASGTHTVRFQNASGSWIDLDAIQVYSTLTPVGAGTYDDTDSAWNYSGTWSTYSGTGPYNNSLHQSNVAGSYAEMLFTGTQATLTYLKAPGRGLIDVYIDSTKVDTIDANSASIVWQATWTSSTLSSGTHTIRFQNASGSWIDLDALQVQ